MDDWLTLKQFKQQLNRFGSSKTPCLFLTNFDKTKFFITTDLDNPNILYKFDQSHNYTPQPHLNNIDITKKKFISKKQYKQKFDKVQNEIINGNTYLLNLTSQTKININVSLKDIFYNTEATFKLFFKNNFTFFSPERFIKVQNNNIYTYPMKGTIDAIIDDAKDKLMNDNKELAEHIMVVDLLRNDLSIIAKNVSVEKFRYIQKIKAGKKELLATSSKIKGQLDNNWQKNLGTLILNLLPAGSVSGTPKKNTCDIIRKVEGYDREFFTGVCGLFDGTNLDSAVMIRFIEHKNGKYFYKSGGGITIDSDMESEYTELQDKVYLPLKE